MFSRYTRCTTQIHGLPSPNFKETIEEFRSQIFALTEKLLEIISVNLGLEKGYVKEAFAGGDKPFFGTK
ncbi:hypothetical protein KI387_008511, partial [Taxus chinensis]